MRSVGLRNSGHLPWISLFAFVLFVLLLGSGLFPSASFAQEAVVTFDPAHTQIRMMLDATLHTVHGVFRLKSGQIRFDPRTGKSQGEFMIDAASGDTGNASRDKKMHQEVLESGKYPEIIFLPERIEGSISTQESSEITLSGAVRIHGREHPLSFVAEVAAPSSGTIHVKTSFSIPYQKWGMKNPSNFFLRVGDFVEIEIDAVARLRFLPPANP